MNKTIEFFALDSIDLSIRTNPAQSAVEFVTAADIELIIATGKPSMVLEFAAVLKGKDGGALSTTALQPLSGHTALAYESSGGVVPLDVLNPAHGHSLAGISKNAASAGSLVELLTHGHLSHNGWQFETGKPVFVGIGGVLTQTPAAPPLAVWRRCVGVALNATTLVIDFQPALFYQEV